MSYLIANQSTGIERDIKPWLTPEDAYVNLLNAFIYRGRTQKRNGAQRLGSLSSNAVGLPVVLPGPLAAGANNYTLSASIGGLNGVVPGSLTITLSVGPTTLTDSQKNGTLQSNGADPVSAIINYSSTLLTITIPAGSPLIGSVVTVTFLKTFPVTRTPCMGIWLRTRVGINFEQTIFFDQITSYIFSPTGFNQIGAATWSGSDSDFFWCINARNPLIGNPVGSEDSFFFATNFNVLDPIRYLNSADAWVNYEPLLFNLPAPTYLLSARCIALFKNRLLFFNVWEGDPAARGAGRNFPNRCRFSWLGDITDTANAFLQSPAGKGGFVDAAVAEEIVSIAVLKDCILVKFETVSWRLVYTGNPYLPFEWQKVNQDFGSDSTFSSVQFDDYALTIGNRAITQDTSVSVQRIDEKIPDEVFDISNFNNGPKRVVGIRDFYKEQVYWTIPYPSASNNQPTYPNYMLNYSYRTGAFAFFKDIYTFLGRFQNQTFYTWGDAPFTWGSANVTWGGATIGDQNSEDAPLGYGFENIAAGNHQGNIFLLQKETENDPAFEIQSIVIDANGDCTVQINNHNLDYGDFVAFSTVQGTPGFNYTNTENSGTLTAGITYFEFPDLQTTELVNLPQSTDTLDPLQGEIIAGTVTATYTQTVPPLTVNFLDNGAGELVADTPGYSATIDYVGRDAIFGFPAVPGGANASSISISYEYSLFNGRIFPVVYPITENFFNLGSVNELTDQIVEYEFPPIAGGAFNFGQLAYLTDMNITSKQFNPLITKDTSLNVPYIDVYVDGTQDGQISIEVRSDDLRKTINPPINTYTGAEWLFSTRNPNNRFWDRIFTNARGEFVQLIFTMANKQMLQGYSYYPFTLHGIQLRIEPSGRLIRVRYP